MNAVRIRAVFFGQLRAAQCGDTSNRPVAMIPSVSALARVQLNPNSSRASQKGIEMITDVHMEPSLFDPLLGIRDVMAGLGGASRGGVYAMLAAGEL